MLINYNYSFRPNYLHKKIFEIWLLFLHCNLPFLLIIFVLGYTQLPIFKFFTLYNLQSIKHALQHYSIKHTWILHSKYLKCFPFTFCDAAQNVIYYLVTLLSILMLIWVNAKKWSPETSDRLFKSKFHCSLLI